jgi:hypothetical protein
MTGDLTPEQKEALHRYAQIVLTMHNAGAGHTQIVTALEEHGWPSERAHQFVDSVVTSFGQDSPQSKTQPQADLKTREQLLSEYTDRMLLGLALVVGGALLTWLSHELAASSPTGGTYRICIGAIVAGTIMFVVGLSGVLKYRR